MSGTLGTTENTESGFSQLIAGPTHIMREITLKADCGDLSRGAVLEMVSVTGTTWQELTAASPTNARAILAEDVSDSASIQRAQAYFVGKYRYEDLVWPAGITTLNKRSALVSLQDRGIVIDEALADVPTTTSTTSSTTTSTTA